MFNLRGIVVLAISLLLLQSTFGFDAPILLKSPPGAADIQFQIADLVTPFKINNDVVQLEAYRIRNKDEWVSIGRPFFLPSGKDGSIFTFTPEAINVQVRLLSDEQRQALQEAAKQQNPALQSPIVNMIPLQSFMCTISFLLDRQEYTLIGQVQDMGRLNPIINFPYSENSDKRKALMDRMKLKADPPEWVCEFRAAGKDVKKNEIRITGSIIQDVALEGQLFGKGGEAFVTRNQMNQLAEKIHQRLSVDEEYEVEGEEFDQKIYDKLLDLAAAPFKQVPIDDALKQLSSFGANFNERDITASEIKRQLSDVLKVEKVNGKEFILAQNDTSRTGTHDEGHSVGTEVGAGVSVPEVVAVEAKAAVKVANDKRDTWNNTDSTLGKQLSEMNRENQDHIQWEIDGNRIIPKSLNVAKVTKSKMSTDITISYKKSFVQDAQYKKTITLQENTSFVPATKENEAEKVKESVQNVNENVDGILQKVDLLSQKWNAFVRDTAEKINNIQRALDATDYLSKYCNYPIYEDKSKQHYQLDVWIKHGTNRFQIPTSTPPRHYKLEAVCLVMRHGDRQSLQSYNKNIIKPNYKLTTEDEKAQFRKHLEFLRHFKQVKDRMGEKYELLMNDISEAKTKSKKTKGRLSPRGALQWMQFGERFRKKYESILNFNDVEKFVVYTTKIKRTYNSLVALLHGMLGPFRACKIGIKIHDKHTGRVIFCDQTWCQCNKFRDSRVNQAYAMDDEIYSRYMKNATNNEIDALHQIQQIYQMNGYHTFDQFAPHVCYNSSPCKLSDPCDIREAAKTITRKFFEVKTLQEQVDGHKSEVILKMSYILSRVLALMKNAAILMKEIFNDGRQDSMREGLKIGMNETPLALPLKQVLFGPTKDVSEVQTPFAGSIHFEVYTNQNYKVSDHEYGPYFRVMLFGEERTRDVIFCKNFKDNFCHWSDFENFVNEEIGGLNKLKSYFTEKCSK
uniref:2-phosphoxylose phosphatase 1 n=1 Tax=Romanomermis culicivorax TaxID=13658 RepID=A0A915JN49_ROMCU